MSTTSRALRAAALSAAAVLALTACGGDDSDPLGGPASSPAAGGIGGVATIPDAATKNTDAGAEAFAKYYFEEVLNKAYSSGNISTLIKYTHPQCIICRATVGDISTAWARGKSDGGQVTVSSVDASKAQNVTNVELKLAKTRYVELDRDGKNVFSTPAQNNLSFLVQLQWSNAEKSWVVREIVPPALRKGGSASPTPTP
ncbi:DUF6318 family protein [Sporichthya polymorpha]|uniref:DUF6318 family protein n=1 Tax=Sporichthya polymorpha TaxID=35751 RepID=UPI000367AD6B|nr:DUF6318 family protein [Sporichthya polymorpha]